MPWEHALMSRWRKTRACIKLMRNLGFVVKAYPSDADFMLVTHTL